MAEISVIMPSYNVAKYIVECMESVLSQSFDDMEILCVDARSTDGTLEILQDYVKKDSRIRLILSDKRSYGAQINIGLNEAIGNYIGIVETDDRIVRNMYETLHRAINTYVCDYVKGRPFLYYQSEIMDMDREDAVYVTGDHCGKIIDPHLMPELLEEDIFLWNGLYSRELLEGIRLNESPGAAFQDQGFLLQTIKKAQRAFYLNQVVYYYRQDNAASSVHDHRGFRYILNEYESNQKYVKDAGNDWKSAFYRRMYTQARSRFYSMVRSGGFWEDEAQAAGDVINRLKIAKKDGYLNQKLLGDSLWERLNIYVSGAEAAYIYEKERMIKEKEEREEGENLEWEFPTGVVRWYPFRPGSRLLYVGEEDSTSDMLINDYGLRVSITGIDTIADIRETYDYIVCMAGQEQSEYPKDFLCRLKKLLDSDGTLLLGMNNRLGIRYFCGDRDLYTDYVFDGPEGYVRSGEKQSGRMYSRSETEKMMRDVGMDTYKVYAVLNDLSNAVLIFADGYVPNEVLSNRIYPTYHYPGSLLMQEEKLYDAFMDNNVFYSMANAFLLEYNGNSSFSDALQVTLSLERGRENAMITVIHDTGVVTKQAAWKEGEGRLQNLIENADALKERNIRVLEQTLQGNTLVMPMIEAPTAQVYLTELLKTDKERFLYELDRFIGLIRSSARSFEGEYHSVRTVFLERAMMDMVPLNCFVIDGEYVFFDQEYCEKNVPVNVLTARVIANIFFGNQELQNIVSKKELYLRYGLICTDNENEARLWLAPGWDFLIKIRKERQLSDYHKRVRADVAVVHRNKDRANISVEDYQKIFIDIFKDLEIKKIVIFGAGKYARRFIEKYSKDYGIYAVVDNNKNLWGKHIEGLQNIRIQSPETLGELRENELKVIICMREYMAVSSQLKAMGVTDYAVYDPHKRYPEPERRMSIFARRNADSMEKEDSTADASHIGNGFEKKPYHIGYVAGAFDMFHIGHLNLLRRAKERCDYLIAGVMSDERMFDLKKKHAVIPCNERMQVVAGCRYVDQVEELPAARAGIMDAYNMFHFDCMFSGDDHADNPGWLAERERLREHGSDIVFVPYTKEQSSTEIREKMKR